MSKGRLDQKRRGPPPLPPDQGKRHPIGIRVTKEIRDFIQRMADSQGRSIAQEIELRLLQSYDFEAIAGGPRAVALFRTLASAVGTKFGEDSWVGNRREFLAVRQTVIEMLDVMAPPALDPLGDFATEIRDHLRNPGLSPVYMTAALSFARDLANDLRVPATVRAELTAEIDKAREAAQ
jgi:hypothetical protein